MLSRRKPLGVVGRMVTCWDLEEESAEVRETSRLRRRRNFGFIWLESLGFNEFLLGERN